MHTAPGHGVEDFEIGRAYGLPVISPLDDREYSRRKAVVRGCSAMMPTVIIKDISDLNMLVKADRISHQYPYCWRCRAHRLPGDGTVVRIYRSLPPGYTNAIDNVRWIPGWGRDRIYNMIADGGLVHFPATYLGVPIPIFTVIPAARP